MDTPKRLLPDGEAGAECLGRRFQTGVSGRNAASPARLTGYCTFQLYMCEPLPK